MKIASYVLMALGALSILVGFFLLAGLILYSMTPPLKAEMEAVNVSAEYVKSLDNKINSVKSVAEKAAVAKETKEIAFSLNEEEINSKLIEVLSEGEIPLKEAAVNLRDNRIWFYGEIISVAIPAKVMIIGDASIINNSIRANVDTFELGKLPLSSSTPETVGNILNIIVGTESPFKNLPIKITSIGVDDNSLTVRAVTIPKN